MFDLFCFGLFVLFFVVAAAFTRACEALEQGDD